MTLSGDANSVFILRSESGIGFGQNSEVKLQGGVTADHVFRIAKTTAEIRSGVVVTGTVITQEAIKLSRSATVDGHVVSLGSRVHLMSYENGLHDSALLAG